MARNERYDDMDLPCTSKGIGKKKNIVCKGMTCIGDDKLVIVTKEGNVIIISHQGKVLYTRDTYYKFEDVTTVSKDEIAASGEYFIKFFDISREEVSELAEKEIDFSYHGGPTIHGIPSDGAIIMTSCNVQMTQGDIKPFLRMFNIDGKMIRDIKLTGIAAPTRVILSRKKSLIFLLDQRNKSILCIDMEGKEKWCVFAPNYLTDLVLLPENTLAIAGEMSDDVSYIDDQSGKSVHKNSKIQFLRSHSTNGFLLASDKNGKLFVCPIENDSIEAIKVKTLTDCNHENPFVHKLKELFRK